MQWLELKNATGHFNVEFFNSDPQQISSAYVTGINHITQTGYWAIQADASPLASASIELSFNGPNSGIGTNLTTARVARLENNGWVDYGYTAFTGTAGSRGSVVSTGVASWSTAPDLFTLGSSVPVNGPLALNDDTIRDSRNNTVNNFRGPLQLVAITRSNAQMLTCRTFEKTQAKLCIVNNNGVIVKVISTSIERGVTHLPVEMPLLPAGIYSIQAFTPKGSSNVLRFVYIK
jgi:hypothetical protein